MILQDDKGINHYYIDDIEIGLYETDKVTYEQHFEIKNKVWELCSPKTTSQVGKVMVFGTGGDIKDYKGLEDIFYNPINYETIINTWEDKIEGIFIPAFKINNDGN